MKLDQLSKTTLQLTALISLTFLATPSEAYLLNLQSDANEHCVRSEREIESDSTMAVLIHSFGGLQNIEGRFKLTGLAGEFAKVKFKFASTANGFFVQPKQDPIEEVHLCYRASNPRVLHIRVLTPALAENGVFLVRPAKPGELMIAAKGSNWKFMKFKRIVASEAAGN